MVFVQSKIASDDIPEKTTKIVRAGLHRTFKVGAVTAGSEFVVAMTDNATFSEDDLPFNELVVSNISTEDVEIYINGDKTNGYYVSAGTSKKIVKKTYNIGGKNLDGSASTSADEIIIEAEVAQPQPVKVEM